MVDGMASYKSVIIFLTFFYFFGYNIVITWMYVIFII